MHRIDGEATANALPTPEAAGTAGYFKAKGAQPPTQITGDWLNAVQEEIVGIILARGLSLSKTTRDQLWEAVKYAIQAVEGRTGSGQSVDVTTQWLRGALASFEAVLGDTAVTTICNAVIASTGSSAIGNASAVVGSVDSQAGNPGTGDFASFVGGATQGQAIGPNSAVLGGAYGVAGGENAAVVGCNDFLASGEGAFAAASDGDGEVSGSYSASIASEYAGVAGNRSAAIASAAPVVSGNRAAAIASSDAVVEGADAAVIASVAASKAKGNNSLVAASNKALQKGTNAGVTILSSLWFEPGSNCPAYSVGGGYDASLVTYSGYTWRIESNGGYMRSVNAHTTSGLDYAEVFECVEEIPPGAFAALDLDTGKARLAREGDDLIGLGSANPTVVGGDDGLAWQGRYLRDVWGGMVYEDIEVVDTVIDRVPLLDENGEPVTEVVTRQGLTVEDGKPKRVTFYSHEPVIAEVEREVRSVVRQPKVNPAYDPTRPYVPRRGREGWALLGLTGQMRARVGAEVERGDYLKAGSVPGVAVTGSTGYGMSARVMRIVQPYDEALGYAVADVLVR